MVKNDVANTFAKFVPIRITVMYFGFSSIILVAMEENGIFCFCQTFNCIGFAEISAISELEYKIEKINPIIEK